MLVCRIAYDAPGKDAERQRHYEAHRAHLRSDMARAIVQSGPLFATDGSSAKIGALIVFDVESLEDVELFNAADPFIAHGVYDRIVLARWDRTIG